MSTDSRLKAVQKSPYRWRRPCTSHRHARSELFFVSSPLEGLTNLIPSFGTPSTPPPAAPSSSKSSWPFSSNSSSSSSVPSRSTSPRKPETPAWLSDPVVVGAASAFGAVALAVGMYWSYGRYWRRIRNINDVTGQMLDRKRWVRGVVTSVGDGDNFRLFHTPGPFFHWPLKLRSVPTVAKDLKDETLHIRIAAVDAPENAHFGNPAQPFAKESWDWMKALITGKRMHCQLIRKDQYGRIVAVPYISRMILPDKALPLLMLKQGMGVVYESAGAEYGPWSVDELKAMEAEARKAKRGLWGVKGKFEHPAEYKKRMKIEEGVGDTSTSATSRRASQPKKGLFSSLMGLFGGR